MRPLSEILIFRDLQRGKLGRRRRWLWVRKVIRSRPVVFVAGCIVLLVPAPAVYRGCCEAWERRERRLAEAAFHARMAALPDRVGNFIAKDEAKKLVQPPETKGFAFRHYVEAKTQRSIKVYLFEGLARHVAVESPGLTGNSPWPRKKGYFVNTFRRNAIRVPTLSGPVPLNLSVATCHAKSTSEHTYYCWTAGKRWVTESPRTQFRGWSPAMSIWIVSECDSRDEATMTKECENFIPAIIPQIARVFSDNPL